MMPTGLEKAVSVDVTALSFDFGADDQTNALLLQDAQTFITGNMARVMAAKHAHDLCANNKNGTWGKWCDVVGISRDTGDNMVHIAEQFGNIQIDGQSIFDVRPMKLLYAAARPSTPEPVKQAVFSGDITTYKEYQELMAQLKAEKERADSAENRYNAAITDVNNLAEANSGLMKTLEKTRKDLRGAQESYTVAKNNELAQCDRLKDLKKQLDAAETREEEAWKMHDKAENRAKEAEKQLEGSRQMAEAAKRRADKWQAEAEAARKQPIEAVVDEEEVERRANQKAHDIAEDLAADMTADLRERLEQAASGSEEDARSAYDSLLLAGRNLMNIWLMAKPLISKIKPSQRQFVLGQLTRPAQLIIEEVEKCL